ncbi:hypothetical protein [Streptomyces sp. NPDC051162]|uniref:hypothetical protein n=1 Tax=Streptomyces sp. NPDC051162 TaxID=3154747 RepID=UPI0034195762
MTLSVSAAVLFGIAAFFILRLRYAGPGTAIILFLSGFFTAGTGAYGPIQHLCTAIAQALPNLTT